MAERELPPAPELPPTLRRKIDLSRLALGIERVWPPLAAVLALLAAFVALTWFGVFTLAPFWLHLCLFAGFAIAVAYGLWWLARWRYPDLIDGALRLDLDDPALHRPLATLTDQPAGNDPVAKALWAQHRARAEAAARDLLVAPPVSQLPTRDRYGLAALALLLLVASGFVAGNERLGRLGDAFRFGERAAPPAPPRLDAWIDPPVYTGRAPIFLSGPNAPAQQGVEIPVGSTAIIRVSPGTDISASASAPQIRELPPKSEEKPQAAGIQLVKPAAPAAPPAPNATFERRYAVGGAGTIEVKQGNKSLAQYDLKAIPDLPPTVAFHSIETDDKALALKLRHTMADDYGIAKAEALIGRIDQPGARTLVPAPEVGLSARSGEGESVVTAPEHPWAGVRVSLRLRVSDDIGQIGESEAREAVLPIRRFEHPVSRALIEQRRNLVMSPDDRKVPMVALDSLLVAPERFTRKSGEFIMLSMAARKLRTARSDADLVALVQYLWETAVAFDGDSDLSDAERALRAAEDRLREALERGASPDEVRRLMEDLRQAMNEFLREKMQQAERDSRDNAERQNERNRLTLSQRDLNDMLKRIEELYRQGDTAKAQELLRQLQELMKNMQTARRRPSDQRNREMGEAMDELDKLQREQEQLRDETFRNEQKRRSSRNQPRRDPQGQQGQRGQQQQQGDSDDDDSEDGEDGDSGEDGDQGQDRQQGQNGMQGQQGQNGQGLAERQQGLRNRLKQLRDKLRKGGVPDQEGLEGADGSMGDATENLKRQQGGRAGQDQQRALDELGKAGRNLAQQMQRGEGMGEGEGPGDPDQDQRGRAEQNTDPLGRPLPQDRNTPDNSRVKIPTGGDVRGSIGERAQRVLEELRRRLGESLRPREELDYLERLLRQR